MRFELCDSNIENKCCFLSFLRALTEAECFAVFCPRCFRFGTSNKPQLMELSVLDDDVADSVRKHMGLQMHKV